jgi:serine O-acetyltransferase
MKDFILSIEKEILFKYLLKQLYTFFPDEKKDEKKLLIYVDKAVERVKKCFSHINGKYYSNETAVYFNHLNGDHYTTFLYFVSREAYLDNNELYYFKVSLLNKHLFSIDLFGHIDMPEIFLLVHPLGTIIGRATFENYLVIYQNVTIGGVLKNDTVVYPTFGKGVVCYSKSSILGDVIIGDNTMIGANTNIIGGKFSSGHTIIGNHPDITVHSNKLNIVTDFFKD